MSLDDNALTRLETVNGELGYTTGSNTSRDSRIERYINEYSDLFEAVTGRAWYWQTNHVENVGATGRREIRVHDHRPIDTVNSVHFDDGQTRTEIDSGQYEVRGDRHAERGVIRRINGAWEDTRVVETNVQIHRVPGTAEPHYEVDYDGGYVTPEQDANNGGLTRDLPQDIERAAILYAVYRESQEGQDPTVESISMDSGSITFLAGHRMPTASARTAHRYRDASRGMA